ncbi:glycosyl transferase family 1 [Blastopirellula marina]|uniref:Glycosyl transferase family 1 n=1 Tax=Blastopirellula marina TaxID=124 RepID=A0A2S8G325_9BACT|nr:MULTISPECIES: glycosyltransferase family 4 protein [Pirellulaceae]PQO38823.1 glycosyl transferase family 1 [Blastopirellula marina]RCS55131.1 glycosyltransferase [Bremerella cremea]
MKVLIVNNMAPFVWGGAEELAVHLRKNLELAGHEAEILRIPFSWEPPSRLLSQMLMARTLELSNTDHVIALKFPAYLIRHPNKTLWVLHQYRQAYDLYEAGTTNLVGSEGDQIRQVIKKADAEAFAESKQIFVNSKVTQQRLRQFNNVESKVLLPPVNDPESFQGGSDSGYIFAGGRINGLKRQHLLLEALAQTKKGVRLIIAGPPDSEADAQRLRRMAEELQVSDRVQLDLRFLSRSEYTNYVRHAKCVAYLPFDEDSLGYVAMEAATAKKAILTTDDSGGILGLAKHGETGWVTQPNAESLAEAMASAFQDSAYTRELGCNASQYWDSLGVSWQTTIQALLP